MPQVLLGWTWQDPNTDYDVMGEHPRTVIKTNFYLLY